MNQHFRARYYLNLAASLPPHTPYEEECKNEARDLNVKLEIFDMANNAVFNDFAG